jgi:hypothetical protein
MKREEINKYMSRSWQVRTRGARTPAFPWAHPTPVATGCILPFRPGHDAAYLHLNAQPVGRGCPEPRNCDLIDPAPAQICCAVQADIGRDPRARLNECGRRKQGLLATILQDFQW